MANHAPTWVTKAGLGVLTLNSGLAIYRARDDPASILFVSGSYTTLLLLFRCLGDYERAAVGCPARQRARRAVWPLTLALGVVNCDMALAVHKARRDLLGSATCVLISYAVLLALVWLLAREFGRGGHARGVDLGYGQDQGQGRGVGAVVDAAQSTTNASLAV